MGSNFMETNTELGELRSKIDSIIDRAAAEIAEACINRSKDGKSNAANIERDIMTSLEAFSVPDEYKIKVLAKVIAKVSTNYNKGTGYTGKPNKAPKRRQDMFGSIFDMDDDE